MHALPFSGLALGLALLGAQEPPGDATAPVVPTPPGVILIVADGLGTSHEEFLRLVDGPLAADALPELALVRTSTAVEVVSDSAAGATAMATGVRTRNGSVGVDEAGADLLTVAEWAKRHGRRVGFVTTSYIVDATPAAFYGARRDRDEKLQLARELFEFRPDLLFGGGEQYFLPAGRTGRFGTGERGDRRNLLREFRAAGYHVVERPLPGPLPMVGLFAEDDLEGTASDPVTLPAMARAALAAVEHDPRGFFLLIEQEGTDTASHARSPARLLETLRVWNQTVALAREVQQRRPNTVLIVTADHESGGVSLIDNGACGFLSIAARRYQSREGQPFCVQFTTRAHTAAPVPLHAAGIEIPRGVILNTDVHTLLKSALE